MARKRQRALHIDRRQQRRSSTHAWLRQGCGEMDESARVAALPHVPKVIPPSAQAGNSVGSGSGGAGIDKVVPAVGVKTEQQLRPGAVGAGAGAALLPTPRTAAASSTVVAPAVGVGAGHHVIHGGSTTAATSGTRGTGSSKAAVKAREDEEIDPIDADAEDAEELEGDDEDDDDEDEPEADDDGDDDDDDEDDDDVDDEDAVQDENKASASASASSGTLDAKAGRAATSTGGKKTSKSSKDGGSKVSAHGVPLALQLPVARVKKLIKSNKDIKVVQSGAVRLTTEAARLFAGWLAKRAFRETRQGKRRIIAYRDVAATVSYTDSLDFAEDIVPPKVVHRAGVPLKKAVTKEPVTRVADKKRRKPATDIFTKMKEQTARAAATKKRKSADVGDDDADDDHLGGDGGDQGGDTASGKQQPRPNDVSAKQQPVDKAAGDASTQPPPVKRQRVESA